MNFALFDVRILGPEQMQELTTEELKQYYEAMKENSTLAWHVLRVKEAIDDVRD